MIRKWTWFNNCHITTWWLLCNDMDSEDLTFSCIYKMTLELNTLVVILWLQNDCCVGPK
jgi:hypothetical protein